MKKYFCDVCGVELPEWNEATAPRLSPAVEVCELTDLCSRCEAVAFGMDVPALVLAELKRLAAPAPEQSAEATDLPSNLAPPPLRRIMGKGAEEKRAILTAIEAYRKEHGPGSIAKLAQLAKVNESELRDMIQCVPTPIATWRKVGKVLGVDRSGEGGANP